MKEFSTTNVKFHVSGNRWVMDCPALNIKGIPLCHARYPKHDVLAIARDTIKANPWANSASIIKELWEAYSKSIREIV